jgi:hypothetical protein
MSRQSACAGSARVTRGHSTSARLSNMAGYHESYGDELLQAAITMMPDE